jgi:hypothetical protein
MEKPIEKRTHGPTQKVIPRKPDELAMNPEVARSVVSCDGFGMGPETNPEDEKRKLQKGEGNKGDDPSGARPENASGAPFDLSQFGFCEAWGGDGTEAALTPKRLAPGQRKPIVLTEEEAWEEGLEEERLRKLGEPFEFLAIDRSKLLDGPPMTLEEHAALWRLNRGQMKGPELRDERLRLHRMVATYRNWFEANSEILDHLLREIGDEIRGQN